MQDGIGTFYVEVLRFIGHLPIPHIRGIFSRLGILHGYENAKFIVPFFGIRWSGDLSQLIDQQIFFFGSYAPNELDFLSRCASIFRRDRGRVIFMDIGANVGQHSVFMALKADYVFAFEPNSDAGEQLVENIRLNNLENVSLFPFALGSVDAEAVLGSGFEGNNASRSLKWSIDSSKDTRVEVRVGDQIVNGLGASRIDLIKVDVEGYEREVFLGLTETLKRDRPVILFELMTAEAKNAFRFGSELSSIFYPNVEIYSLAKNKSAQLGKVDWTHNDFVAIPAEVVPLFSDLIH